MTRVHQETEDGITYTLYIEQDDMPVRGNAFASGDDAEDRAVENDILARLNDGDIWAWAQTTCEASITVDGYEFTGEDHLGGCNYFDTEEFVAANWEDMKATAHQELMKRLQAATKALLTKKGNQ